MVHHTPWACTPLCHWLPVLASSFQLVCFVYLFILCNLIGLFWRAHYERRHKEIHLKSLTGTVFLFSLEYFPRPPYTPLEQRSRQTVSDNSQGRRMKLIQYPPPSTLSPMLRTILWQVQFLSSVDQSTLLSTGCSKFLGPEG